MTGLSIVIPAYNEELNVAATVREVADVAEQLPLEHEIIVVNDGSRDHTGEIVQDLMKEVPHLRLLQQFPNRGYGGALKAGFEAASYELIAFIPADGQFSFSEIARFLETLNGDRSAAGLTPDIVCGYRAKRQDNMLRRLNGWGWNTAIRVLFGYLARDVDCGFKLLRKKVVAQVSLPSDGAMIDTELLAGAKARGFRIANVPVTHLPRTAGEASGANLQVIVKAFRELLAFRLELSRETRGTTAPPRLMPKAATLPVDGERKRAS
jgi:glycosyltransferase involved in cell wall biosynthesis